MARQANTMSKPMWPRRGLYLLTPDDDDCRRLLARVNAVLDAAVMLQYRNKRADPGLRLAQATALLHRCRCAGIPLIINDDVELAARIGADGVHLGENDDEVAAARVRLGAQRIIGVSCYDDAGRARAMAAAGADYLAFGAFFPSANKPQARRADPRLLHECAGLGRPLVAIGGVTADNGRALLAAGADLLAVIGDVFAAADPAAAARAYPPLFE